MYLLHVTCPPI
ncbi:hypothetical protein RDI58_015247 [Solanum bulbocastanum]|uniref:Uncharacterized protein n=1 Tax=Solanum bulbocastanum TaxID=147425 RepID=A0AAN8TK74_SOLBU